jgi:hypothetical protein
MFSSSNLITPTSSVDNGALAVYVVNPLVTPETSVAPIYVNVYVSAPDLELNVLRNSDIDRLTLYDVAPTMGDISAKEPSDDEFVLQAGPLPEMADDTIQMVEETHVNASSLVNFGEKISSIRQLLKRYTYYMTHSWVGCAYSDTVTQTVRDIPLHPGGDPNGIHTNGTPPIPWNFVNMSLITYFSSAYSGCRGGIRYLYCNQMNRETPGYAHVYRNDSSAVFSSSYQTIDETSDSTVAAAYLGLFDNCAGSAITPMSVAPATEVELPYYSSSRFYNPKFYSTATDASNAHTLVITKADAECRSHSFVSAAEDYGLYFYTGPPIYYLDV